MKNILVVGSINIDIVNIVDKHPVPGETIISSSTSFSFGGKGANQAVAAAKAGSNVQMIGAIGDSDLYGEKLLQNLQRNGINTNHIIRKNGLSGTAYISVDERGENIIILSEGTNGQLSVNDLYNSLDSFKDSMAVLLQNEIPWETSFSVMKLAKEKGIEVYFNPAPAFLLPKVAYPLIDYLILNETEAEILTGITLAKETQLADITRRFIDEGTKNVILTLGKRGSFFMDSSYQSVHVPSFQVQTVDTTAAGDSFIGAFAYSNSISNCIRDSLIYASATAALTVTRNGAQNAIPTHEEVLAFLEGNSQKNDS